MTGNSRMPDKAKALAIAKYLLGEDIEFENFQNMKIKRCHFEAVSFKLYGNIQSWFKFYTFFKAHSCMVKTQVKKLKRAEKIKKGCSSTVVTSTDVCSVSVSQDQGTAQQDHITQNEGAASQDEAVAQQNKTPELAETTKIVNLQAMDVEACLTQTDADVPPTEVPQDTTSGLLAKSLAIDVVKAPQIATPTEVPQVTTSILQAKSLAIDVVEAPQTADVTPTEVPQDDTTSGLQVINKKTGSTETSTHQALKRPQNLYESSIPAKKVKSSKVSNDRDKMSSDEITESENVTLKNEVLILKNKNKKMEEMLKETTSLQKQLHHMTQKDQQKIKDLIKEFKTLQCEYNKKLQYMKENYSKLKQKNIELRKNKNYALKDIDQIMLQMQKIKDKNEKSLKEVVDKYKIIYKKLLKTKNQHCLLNIEFETAEMKHKNLQLKHDNDMKYLSSNIANLNIMNSNLKLGMKAATQEKEKLEKELHDAIKAKDLLKTMNNDLEKDNHAMGCTLKVKQDLILSNQKELKNKLKTIDNLEMKLKMLQKENNSNIIKCIQLERQLKTLEPNKKLEVLNKLLKKRDKQIMIYEHIFKNMGKQIPPTLLHTYKK